MAKTRNKAKRSKGDGGARDFAMVAGRGPAIPRQSLGADTLLGIAQSQRRTLAVAVGVSTATGATGGYTETTYTLNQPYQFDGSTSAAGFAKYMAFYSKCFVVGARAFVRGNVITSAMTKPVLVGVSISTNATSFASNTAAIENGLCKYTTIFVNPDHFAFEEAVDVKRFLNKPNVLDDPQLFTTVSAPPSQVIDLHVFMGSIGTTGAAINVGFEIEVLFDCVFTDPIPFT